MINKNSPKCFVLMHNEFTAYLLCYATWLDFYMTRLINGTPPQIRCNTYSTCASPHHTNNRALASSSDGYKL